MIKYKLLCKNCNLSFDSWFASSQEFEKLKKRKLLNCLKCNSKKIEKNLMAPKLINTYSNEIYDQKNFKLKRINKKIKEYQNMLVKTLLMKLDLFIIIIKKKTKGFSVPHLQMK